MLVCLPFCQKDHDRAADLVKWIGELGGCKTHDCFLVVDVATPYNEVVKIRDMAETCFKSVKVVPNEYHVSGWIPGSVSLFTAAAKEASGQPFLFLEPDSSPLKPGWLDEIESAYKLCGKPFMGAFVTHTMPKRPSPYLEGVSVYPANAYEIMRPLLTPADSWVFTCAPVVMPQAVNTPLVCQLWGMAQNAPVFAEKNIPGSNVFCLAQIPKEAVIHHRCKDGSLIRLLRRHMGINGPEPKPITTVFAFCGKDANLMAKSMEWIAEIQGMISRTAVLHFDGTVPTHILTRIQRAASRAFAVVIENRYQTPRTPYLGWPSACNWAFMQACKLMEHKIKTPWLWFEGDCVAVATDWLYRIESEYQFGGKPFMGCIIGGMGHMNGTAVYPCDAAKHAPAILTCKTAWDVAIAAQIIPTLTHKGNDVIQHCREMSGGECHECHGNPPVFRSASDLNAVKPTVGMFHPSKDGTLIDRLRERKNGR